MPKTSKDVEKLAKDAKVEIIDLRFVDLPGSLAAFLAARTNAVG